MSTARDYLTAHRKVLRSDLVRVGVKFPDREVARLEAEDTHLIVALSDGSGWLVTPKVDADVGAKETGVSEAPAAPPTKFWYCSRVGCGQLGRPDDYTTIDDKARYTTGKCPKHKKVVLVADTRLPF